MSNVTVTTQANQAEPVKSVLHPNILVVDDDSLMVRLLVSYLHQEQYQTASASDGSAGLDEWRDKLDSSNPYQLLIIDLKMPKMDGFTLLKHIRQVDANIPIIILTGYADLENAYRLLKQYKIADFLTKPLSGCERLLFTVKNALEKAALSDELKSLNDELEQRVERRTIALQHAKEQAEAANETKTRFLNRMKHELRTPLNAILGFAQIQQLNVNATEQEKLNTEHIFQAGMQLLTQVNDIMTIDTIDTIDRHKAKAIPLQKCSLDEAILESIRFVEAQAAQYEVVIKYQPSGGFIKASPYRLKQVLSNLLGNAIKFNQPGGFVDITVDQLVSNETQINIVDSGIGIAPQDQQAIFEPFTRLTYADRNEIGGTGIGLALSKYLMEQMGGEIGLYSEPDNGSTFWLRFEA
ncbi:MAG: signal transduction histidine kinase [Phenylobacterium sp.]|jgi:signal transduction histidine kinase